MESNSDYLARTTPRVRDDVAKGERKLKLLKPFFVLLVVFEIVWFVVQIYRMLTFSN